MEWSYLNLSRVNWYQYNNTLFLIRWNENMLPVSRTQRSLQSRIYHAAKDDMAISIISLLSGKDNHVLVNGVSVSFPYND